jgi:hypothetical protein
MNLKEIKLEPLLDTLTLTKIPDEIYFSEKYSKYVSNSRLGKLNPKQGGSPEQFFAPFVPSGYSAALEMGSAVHELTLQPEFFELANDLGKPTAKLGAMADELYPVFVKGDVTPEDVIEASNKVDYYKGKMTKDLINKVLTSCTPYWKKRSSTELSLERDKELIHMDTRSMEVVKSCVEALKNNTQVQRLLHPEGLIEQPIIANEQAILMDVKATCPNGKEFILHLKSKLDNYTIDTENNTIIVNDVKTIGKILSEFDNNIAKFHYSREMAMYLYLLKLCSKKFHGIENPKIQANYLVVSTIPNFYTKVQPVTYGQIVQGFKEFQTLLKYVAYQIGYHDYSLDERPGKYQL